MTIFTLPDLGEGLHEAEVHAWHVNVGDHVVVDQLLVSMETAKAVVEVPSPCTGIVTKLYGKAGDTLEVGSPLAEFEEASSKAQTAPAPQAEKASAPKASAATVAGAIEIGDRVITESAMGISPQAHSDTPKILPPLRHLAKLLNINLTQIKPSGAVGEITLSDFAQAIKQQLQITGAPAAAHTPIPHTDLPAIPLKGVRKAMAQSMALAHREVAAVTLFEDVSIAAWPKGTDITARLIRAIAKAAKAEPYLNAWYDPAQTAIIPSDALHLGLAVDTPDGLFVPVIKDADKQTPETLRKTVERFKQEVPARTIAAEELKGATITLSNFGTFAGRYATPMIVPPMVAIIGAGRLRPQLVLKDDKVVTERILPLSLSFDHRAATGGEATRFLATMIADLVLAE